jgi:hypothetical protein
LPGTSNTSQPPQQTQSTFNFQRAQHSDGFVCQTTNQEQEFYVFIEMTALSKTGEATSVAYLKVHSIVHPLSGEKEEVARACRKFYENFRGLIIKDMHYEFEFPPDLELSPTEWDLLSNLFSQYVVNLMESAQILRRV